jgi:hypothetical protein
MKAADIQIDIGADTSDFDRGMGRVNGVLDGIGANFVGGALQEYFMGLTRNLKDLGMSFLMANANAETMRMSLEVATGSVEKANELFGWLQNLAAQTPFEFPELMQAAINLESLGVSAEKYLGVIGDTAAGTNKSIDQVTQAFLDAQVGEFERLKEFGIRTVEEGGKTYFQYMKNGEMVKVEIDRNNAEMIESTLSAIWNDKYGGAMEKQSATFIGQWSTLKDNINLLMQQASMGVFNFAKKGLEFVNEFISVFTGRMAQGQGIVHSFLWAIPEALRNLGFEEAANKITPFIKSIENGLNILGNVITTVADIISGVLAGALSLVAAHFGTIGPIIGAVAKAFASITGVALVIQGITAAVSLLGAALAFIFSPIGLLIAAVTLLFLAWDHNWFGIQERVAQAWAAISPIFDWIMDKVSWIRDGFDVGGWSEAWNRITSSVSEAWGLIQNALAGINWDGIWEGIKSAASSLTKQLTGIVKSVGSFGKDLLKTITSTLGPLAASIITRVKSAFNDINWADLFGTLRTAIGNALTTVLQAVTTGLAKLYTVMAAAINAVPWGDIGALVARGLVGIVAAIVGVVGLIGAAIFDAVQNVDWGALGLAFLGYLKAILFAVKDFLGGFLVEIAEMFWSVDWSGVWDGIKNAASAAFSWIINAISNIDWGALISGGWDIIQTGLSKAWDMITDLDWGAIIPDFGKWSDWITSKLSSASAWGLALFGKWSDYITKKLGSLADWGIGTFGSWTDWIGHKLSGLAAWGIGLFNWADWISSVTWPDWALEFVSWLGDNLPSWPSKEEILQAVRDWLDQFNPFGSSKETKDAEAAQQNWQDNPKSGTNTYMRTLPTNTDLRGYDDPYHPMDANWGVEARPIIDLTNALKAAKAIITETSPAFKGLETASGAAGRVMGGVFTQAVSTADREMQKTASTTPMIGQGFLKTADDVKGSGSTIQQTLLSMASTASTQSTAMQSVMSAQAITGRTNVTQQFSQMSTSAVASILGMRTSSAVQMALMASNAQSSGTQMNTGLTSWALGAQVNLAASMLTFVSIVRNTGTSGYNAGLYAGSMIGQGFAAGMTSYLAQIRVAANQMVIAASQAVIAKAMISSPSKLFGKHGGWSALGYVDGMLSKIPAARKAGRLLVEAAEAGAESVAFERDMAPPPVQGISYGTGAGNVDGSPQVIVHQNVTLMTPEPKKFAEFLNAARRGAEANDHLQNEQAFTDMSGDILT